MAAQELRPQVPRQLHLPAVHGQLAERARGQGRDVGGGRQGPGHRPPDGGASLRLA
jgi:hypothetical protein